MGYSSAQEKINKQISVLKNEKNYIKKERDYNVKNEKL